MNKEKIIEILEKMNLGLGEYVVLGSGSLVLRNLKDKCNDLDIGITKKAFLYITKKYQNLILDCNIEFVVKDKIFFEYYDGFCVQSLDLLLKNKKKRNLTKDKIDIEIINNFFKCNPGEYTSLYYKNGSLSNMIMYRKKGCKLIPPKGFYNIVVECIIEDNKGNFLLQKSVKDVECWSITGGHVKYGQSSLDAVINEVKEELDYDLDVKKIKLFKRYIYSTTIKDIYYYKNDIEIERFNYQVEEVKDAKFFSKKDIIKLIKSNKLRYNNIRGLNDFFMKVV